MPHSSPVYPCGRCGCQAYAILSGSGKWLKDDEVGRRRNKGVKALPHCQWTVRAPAAPLAASTLRSPYDSCFQLAPTYVRTAVVLPNRILRWSYRTTYCGCYGAESCSSGSSAWSPERGMFMGDLYFSSRILASRYQAFRRARLNVLAFSLPLTLRRNFGFCAGFPSIIPSSISCLLSPSWISPCGWFIIRSIFHVLGHLLFLPVKSKEKGTKHGQHGLSKSTTAAKICFGHSSLDTTGKRQMGFGSTGAGLTDEPYCATAASAASSRRFLPWPWTHAVSAEASMRPPS